MLSSIDHHFVPVVVDQVIKEIISYDKIPLMTVLYFASFNKILFSFVKSM